MDGAFERVNASILKGGVNSPVVSLVGKVIHFNGVDTATIEAADGGQVQVTHVDVGSFNYVPNMICEIMGGPMGEDTIQVSVHILLQFVSGFQSSVTHSHLKSYKYTNLYTGGASNINM